MRSKAAIAAVAFIAAASVAVFFWGRQFGPEIKLPAAPFYASWRPRVNPATLLPLAIAALVVWKGADLAARMSWNVLLVCAFGATLAWGVSLALVDGPQGLALTLAGPHEYLAALPKVRAPGEFLRTFVERIDTYPTHVEGHPPGLVVGLWWLDRVGLGGVPATAAIAIAAGSACVPAALIAAREAAGASPARRAAPFLVLAPAAIWMVTSSDAIYAGVAAWTVAAMTVSARRNGLRADVLALIGGVLLGLCLHLSYGLVLIVPVGLAIGVWHRRYRTLAIASVGAAIVAAVFVLKGFWWYDGISATGAEYYAGVASLRPFSYFVIANLVVFAVLVGPAAVGGLAFVRDRGLMLLVGSALAAILVADLSGLSKGEVERIWLPWWPWVALAAGALPDNGRRVWLGASALTAIVLQSLLFSPW